MNNTGTVIQSRRNETDTSSLNSMYSRNEFGNGGRKVSLGSCAQLYSMSTETPQLPPPHLGSYTRALLVSQDTVDDISL
jgi:hypothetical protein